MLGLGVVYARIRRAFLPWLLRRDDARRETMRELRRRLRRAGRRLKGLDDEIVVAAREVHDQRARLFDAFVAVQACGDCARAPSRRISGRHGPRALDPGPWVGGRCCSAKAQPLFDDQELLLLAAGGTRPRHLRGPAGPDQSCVFRGLAGCVLPPRHRPTVCLGYICHLLADELRRQGRLQRLAQLTTELEAARRRFGALVDRASCSIEIMTEGTRSSGRQEVGR